MPSGPGYQDYKNRQKKQRRNEAVAAGAKQIASSQSEQKPIEHSDPGANTLGQVAGGGSSASGTFKKPSGLASRRAHRGGR